MSSSYMALKGKINNVALFFREGDVTLASTLADAYNLYLFTYSRVSSTSS
jgi:hypothetical protein